MALVEVPQNKRYYKYQAALKVVELSCMQIWILEIRAKFDASLWSQTQQFACVTQQI